jgi:hypothetical protein
MRALRRHCPISVLAWISKQYQQRTSTCCCKRCSISCAFATLLLELHTIPSSKFMAPLLTEHAWDPNIMVPQLNVPQSIIRLT